MSIIEEHVSFSFGHGIVETKELVRVVCEIEIGDGKQPALARWQGSGKPWAIFPMKWMPVRLAITEKPEPCVFALCGDGTVGFGYGGYAEESINSSPNGPKGLGPLRTLRTIGQHLYAAGMGRQVYRRLGPSNWEVLAPDQVPALGTIDVCGFTSLDGADEDDLWAVGFKGEIWHRYQNRWQQMESPTNLTLHVVRMIDPQQGYAAGKKGLVLRYSGVGWNILTELRDVEDIWGLEWFSGTVYAASSNHLYIMKHDGTFDTVETPGLSSFGHLHAADGILWSFGTLQLAWSHDGLQWFEEKPML